VKPARFRLLASSAACAVGLFAQGLPVTPERLLHADKEPGNWLMYSGGYSSWRFSSLSQIDTSNERDVSLAVGDVLMTFGLD
jgi:hypothetical protein